MTLNQIKKRLEQIIGTHALINQTYIGDFSEFQTLKDITYPALHIETLRGNLSMGSKSVTYTFTFTLFDLINISVNSLGNEWDVKSDLCSIAMDLVQMITSQQYTGWTVVVDSNIEVGKYKLNDMAGYVTFDMLIASRFDPLNKCIVPVN
jgi:hypothetical protein